MFLVELLLDVVLEVVRFKFHIKFVEKCNEDSLKKL